MSSCNCSSIHVHKAVETTVPVETVQALFEKSFSDLLFEAQTVHRQNFDPNTVQLSTLLSIKTGGCPEDCGYCPQSKRHPNAVEDRAHAGCRCGCYCRARRQGRGRHALLHGRRLARPQAARPRPGADHGAATTETFAKIQLLAHRGAPLIAARQWADLFASTFGGQVCEAGDTDTCDPASIQQASLAVVAVPMEHSARGVAESISHLLRRCTRTVLFVPA